MGTPQELTDYSGEIMCSAKYRAYGNLAVLDVAEIDNPLRFQGQYFDGETGLHYNRHRYYNPGTGRFLTPDPIKLAGGVNSYRYVPNPTEWVDPLGLDNCPGATINNSIKNVADDPLTTHRTETLSGMAIPLDPHAYSVKKVLAPEKKSHGITYQKQIYFNWYGVINMNN